LRYTFELTAFGEYSQLTRSDAMRINMFGGDELRLAAFGGASNAHLKAMIVALMQKAVNVRSSIALSPENADQFNELMADCAAKLANY